MPTNDVEYDLNLLAIAPAPPYGNSTNPIQYQATQPRPEPYQPQFNTYTPDATVGNFVPSTTYIPPKPSPSAEKKPFYRTPRGVGIIIISVVFLIAIAFGVIGAVRNSLR